MSVPRVMFVNHTSKIAGAELVLLDLVRPWQRASAFLFEDGPLNGAMNRLGLQVIRSRWGEGLSGIHRDGSLWKAAPLACRLCAIVTEIGYAARRHDVIYANSQKAFVLAAFATLFARRPLVWHLHDIMDGAHFGSMQRRLQVALANRLAARVIVPSDAAAAAFVGAGGRRDIVEVVPNGISVAPDTGAREQIRKELALPDAPLVGVFSRLAPWKGQHVALQAIAKLPGVHGIIVGDALFGENDYAASLRELVAKLGIAERVHFLGHRSDVAELMRAVDVMVHPSVHPEPFGRTLVEAMLAGVPVIATDTGAASDILQGGKAGTLVRPDDADDIAAAIARVLADPDSAEGSTRIRRDPRPNPLRRDADAAIRFRSDPTGRRQIRGIAVQIASTVSQRNWSVPGWVPAVIVLIATAAIGPSLGSLSRPVFVIACGAAGWYAWRCSPAAHLQAAIVLFTFAPLVRRIVDLSIGFDQAGLMLVGPLLALLGAGAATSAPPRRRALARGADRAHADRRRLRRLRDDAHGVPGRMDERGVRRGEMVVPLLYAAAVGLSADRDEMVQAAASAFMVILPITGVIGLVQYVDPPEWDRYWMQFAPIMSAGQPIPYGVRIFSTMNGPASFATFTAVGLLLVCFLRPRWYSRCCWRSPRRSHSSCRSIAPPG